MLSVDGIPSENGIFQEVSQEVKNLQEDIKTGKFKNAYLLFGEEAYLKIQYKEKLILLAFGETEAFVILIPCAS